MNETTTLAEYLSETSFKDLPADVVATAKLSILDTVGVGLLASRRPWSRIASDVVAENGSKESSSVWGQSYRTSAQQAALVNATAAHGIEMDDRRPFIRVHAGSVAIPVALAVAEANDADGKELITSVVSGYELGYRVGHSTRVQPGIHAAGHIGVWVGVGASGRGYRLDPAAFTNAMGLAGSMATSALAEFTYDSAGTMVKRLHAGLSAHHGVLAAQLASHGFTAPSTVLEGANGYCTVFARSPEEIHLDRLTRDLGTHFSIMEREIKPYSAWGGSHTTIESVKGLMAEHEIAPEDIASVRVGGSDYLVSEHEDPRPRSIMAAQYSLPFITAVAICRGADSLVDPDRIWTESLLDDVDVTDMAARTTLFVDDDLEAKYLDDRHYGDTKLIMELKDGTSHERVANYSKGTLQMPMSKKEIEDKFRTLCGELLGDSRVDEIIAVVDDLDDAKDLSRLSGLTRLAQ